MDSKTKAEAAPGRLSRAAWAPNEIRKKLLRSRSYARVAKRRIFKNSNGRWLTLLARPCRGQARLLQPEEI